MVIVLALLFCTIFIEYVELATVETTSGFLSGLNLRTPRGKKYYAFLGVPYAAPPLGKLRFKKPQPVDYWQGVRSAHNYSSRCIQYVNDCHSETMVIGDEDCLYLNIYSPSLPYDIENQLKDEYDDYGDGPDQNPSIEFDTLFYIHGGAFKYGGGDEFTPDYILEKHNIIFVSINYRLGPFGFLSTEDGAVPGNAGLKDQVLALKWIHNNIKTFGGNKYKITLSGWSAGAASVHLHYFSPWSRGLFRQGISLSGSAFCPWLITENARSTAQTLGESFECPTHDSKQLVLCLQQIPAKDILLQVEKLFLPWYFQPFSKFGPVIEKSSKVGFLNKRPYDMLMDGEVTDARWLASVTDAEGIFPAARFVNDDKLLQELDENWNDIVPHLLYYNHTVAPDLLNDVSESIRQFYLGGKEDPEDRKQGLIKMIGDRLFVLGVEQAALVQAAVVSSSVYVYRFAYKGTHSLAGSCGYTNFSGAAHGDDLIYLFKHKNGKFPLTLRQDKLVMYTMIDMLYSFIWQGIPKINQKIQWRWVLPEPLHRRGNATFMHISSGQDFKVVSKEYLANRHFWEELPINELWNINRNFSSSKRVRQFFHNDEL